MSSLTTEAIAFRAAGLWAIGVFTLAALNAYSYRPSRGPRDSLWLIIPGLLAKLAVLMGPAGVALLVGRWTSQLTETAAMAAITVAILAGYIGSSVLVQVLQNVMCLIIGAPAQPIRLWRQNEPRRRRKRRNS